MQSQDTKAISRALPSDHVLQHKNKPDIQSRVSRLRTSLYTVQSFPGLPEVFYQLAFLSKD